MALDSQMTEVTEILFTVFVGLIGNCFIVAKLLYQLVGDGLTNFSWLDATKICDSCTYSNCSEFLTSSVKENGILMIYMQIKV